LVRYSTMARIGIAGVAIILSLFAPSSALMQRRFDRVADDDAPYSREPAKASYHNIFETPCFCCYCTEKANAETVGPG
jgi:hypothetical protein